MPSGAPGKTTVRKGREGETFTDRILRQMLPKQEPAAGLTLNRREEVLRFDKC